MTDAPAPTTRSTPRTEQPLPGWTPVTVPPSALLPATSPLPTAQQQPTLPLNLPPPSQLPNLLLPNLPLPNLPLPNLSLPNLPLPNLLPPKLVLRLLLLAAAATGDVPANGESKGTDATAATTVDGAPKATDLEEKPKGDDGEDGQQRTATEATAPAADEAPSEKPAEQALSLFPSAEDEPAARAPRREQRRRTAHQARAARLRYRPGAVLVRRPRRDRPHRGGRVPRRAGHRGHVHAAGLLGEHHVRRQRLPPARAQGEHHADAGGAPPYLALVRHHVRVGAAQQPGHALGHRLPDPHGQLQRAPPTSSPLPPRPSTRCSRPPPRPR